MQKTNKAVRKRFKISAKGKVMHSAAGRRHLAASKKAKKRRATKSWARVHDTDTHRVFLNLPFGGK
jgi:large subunit ribosomal protein L35